MASPAVDIWTAGPGPGFSNDMKSCSGSGDERGHVLSVPSGGERCCDGFQDDGEERKRAEVLLPAARTNRHRDRNKMSDRSSDQDQ
ncbi:uncharacterized protein V6R79_003339 [Siganus canaliculatus]